MYIAPIPPNSPAEEYQDPYQDDYGPPDAVMEVAPQQNFQFQGSYDDRHQHQYELVQENHPRPDKARPYRAIMNRPPAMAPLQPLMMPPQLPLPINFQPPPPPEQQHEVEYEYQLVAAPESHHRQQEEQSHFKVPRGFIAILIPSGLGAGARYPNHHDDCPQHSEGEERYEQQLPAPKLPNPKPYSKTLLIGLFVCQLVA